VNGTVKPDFMTWEIEHPTPEGLVHLGEVMKQFILWHKKDIVVEEQVVEDGEAYSSARDNHTPNLPHSSPTPSEHMTDKPQTSLAHLIEQGHDEMPQRSLACHIEQVHDEMPHPCPTEQGLDVPLEPSRQARPIPKQGLPSKKEDEGAHESKA